MKRRDDRILRLQAVEELPVGTHQFAPRLYVRREDKGGTTKRTVLFRWATTVNGKTTGHVKSLGAWDRARYGHYLAESRRAGTALDAGRDPVIVLDEGVAPGTFKEAAAAYMADNLAAFTSELHRRQWRASVEATYPVLGNLRIDQLEIAHIVKALADDWLRVPVLAKRLRMRLELIIDYALARGDIQRANPAALGLLRHRLPRQPKRRIAPMRALAPDRIAALFAALDKQPPVSAAALRLVLLTVARSGEVRGMRWQEIDWQRAIWTVPASRMKARKAHRVPLSAPALAILADLKAHRLASCPFVFFGADRQSHISKDTVRNTMIRAGFTDGVVHGVRSTFKDWARNLTPKPDWELVELSLAHEVGGHVERAYGRDDLVELRRPLMAQWAAHVTSGPKLVKLPTASRDGSAAEASAARRPAKLRVVR